MENKMKKINVVIWSILPTGLCASVILAITPFSAIAGCQTVEPEDKPWYDPTGWFSNPTTFCTPEGVSNTTTDIFPGRPFAQGQWSSIQQGHALIPMQDGRVLDWIYSTGTWRLWNYNPNNTDDIFPGKAVAQGQWSSIRQGHALIPMQDGRVLDWVPADGTWRLWNYNPNNTDDIFPGKAVAQGQWSSIRQGHALIPMQDGRVLDWAFPNGFWRLWNYSL